MHEEDLNQALKQIKELKERAEGIYKSIHGIAANKPDLIIEVLREHYKQRIEKSDWAIESILSNKEENMVKFIKDDTEFYKKQLAKLGGEKSENVLVFDDRCKAFAEVQPPSCYDIVDNKPSCRCDASCYYEDPPIKKNCCTWNKNPSEQDLCPKCNQAYDQHIQTGTWELICPKEKEPPDAGSASARESIDRQTNYCSNCGRLNDICGVFLRKINLCDSCISTIFEIVVDKILVEKADLEDVKGKAEHIYKLSFHEKIHEIHEIAYQIYKIVKEKYLKGDDKD